MYHVMHASEIDLQHHNIVTWKAAKIFVGVVVYW